MRSGGDDHTRSRRGRARRRRLCGLPVAVLLSCLATGPAAGATPSDPVVIRDPPDATEDGLDLTRVQLQRAGDGRLRGALTLSRTWRTRDLPADDGPPGSLCLRLWTRSESTGSAPDHLVCMTADSAGRDLRGSVLTERDGSLVRVGSTSLTRSSARTVIVRFAQSAIGRPDSVRFAGEVTPPGCVPIACVDTAPDAPATATLTLRTS